MKGINVLTVIIYFYEVYNITSYIEKDNYNICKQQSVYSIVGVFVANILAFTIYIYSIEAY